MVQCLDCHVLWVQILAMLLTGCMILACFLICNIGIIMAPTSKSCGKHWVNVCETLIRVPDIYQTYYCQHPLSTDFVIDILRGWMGYWQDFVTVIMQFSFVPSPLISLSNKKFSQKYMLHWNIVIKMQTKNNMLYPIQF